MWLAHLTAWKTALQTASKLVLKAAWMAAIAATPTELSAQRPAVLQLDPSDVFGGALPADRGAAGLRQRLRELSTLASVMQVTAHPDDEQAGLLTYLSRGTGARTALLTLNRGEAGANAAGSEFFDALGLVRTEELLLADRYYGLDDQYFTSAVDYGFSKTMAEAARSWDTTAVLRDMVRVIRQNRPLVVVGRWFGGSRDGHGHHQLAGVLAPLAVAAAADPARFPEQLSKEGLRPWRVRRLFRANVRAGEPAGVVVDAGRYDPWLGESYQSLGSDGYARQRSQTAGRRSLATGAAPQRLQQLAGDPTPAGDDMFAGMDVSLAALFAIADERAPTGAPELLRQAEDAARQALGSWRPDAPWTVVPVLVAGLRTVRAAQGMTPGTAPHATQLLDLKRRQFERAIAAALALQVTALAGPASGDGRPVVPGETVGVQLEVSRGAPEPVVLERVELLTPEGWVRPAPIVPAQLLRADTSWRSTLDLTVPPSAEPSRPPVVRDLISEQHYRWRDGSPDHSPRGADPVRVRATVRVAGELITIERVVRYRRSREPEGVTYPRLVVVPPVSLRALPAVRVVTVNGEAREQVSVEVTGYSLTPVEAAVTLTSSAGARVTSPSIVRVGMGERQSVTFDVTLPAGRDSLTLTASARVHDRDWRDAVTVSEHRELEPVRLYASPTVQLRRVPVTLAAGLRVGYIMGVGDLVPEAIAQLGAAVTLLDATTVAAGDFGTFDAVVIGTRAYAVRPELAAATPALVAYAKQGGNVVILYQTQEFRPETMAPFPAALPNDAEETTEEDAPVRVLAPEHPLLTSPNRITPRDFDGWIEQRGSKFLTQLAPEYTPLVEMHDTGQAAQSGVWVTARVGAGQWNYVALALHRQLPYGVPGAYRILANLLARRVP